MNPIGYWMAALGAVIYIAGVAALHYRVLHAKKPYDVLGSFEAGCPLFAMFLVSPVALQWVFMGNDLNVAHAAICVIGLTTFGMVPMSTYSRVLEHRFPDHKPKVSA